MTVIILHTKRQLPHLPVAAKKNDKVTRDGWEFQ